MNAIETLRKLNTRPCENGHALLVDLIAGIRPRKPGDLSSAIAALQSLTLHLRHVPGDAACLRDYLLDLLAARRHVHLYTDTGVLTHKGFFTTLWERFAHRLLPEARRDDYLKDLLGLVFDRETDHVWVSAIPDAIWGDLIDAINLGSVPHPAQAHITAELINATHILSTRIAALGLDPELVRVYPQLEDFESPFLAQNAELHHVLSAFKSAPAEIRHFDDSQVRVLLDQCDEVLDRIRRLARQTGASVSLTYQLQRGTQLILRLRTILVLANPAEALGHRTAALALFRELVREDNRKYSLRDVWRRATDLLALQVTENASKTGEHYTATTRAEYLRMARSAAGAGVIVGFMALIKLFMGKVAMAPIVQAISYSLNYSMGFMLIHVLHFTVATKQPAMTAATIAATVEESTEKKRASLDGLVELVAVVMRTQIVAILGNVLLAIPVSFAIAFALLHLYGAPPAGPEKSAHLLHDINPFASLALFHAAIAGVCLFLAGLISGYYDNKSSYNRIPDRIRQLRWLRALLGESLLNRLSIYLGNNLGSLAGNFFFGVMLGCMGTIGWILGLPIDIRHVTFSAANFAYALVGLEFQVPITTVLISLLGIAMVGITNLTVSFSLALYVALKSRQVRFDRSGELIVLLWKRFVSSPRDFFLPPRADLLNDKLASPPAS
jgi:site-specific recombinase